LIRIRRHHHGPRSSGHFLSADGLRLAQLKGYMLGASISGGVSGGGRSSCARHVHPFRRFLLNLILVVGFVIRLVSIQTSTTCDPASEPKIAALEGSRAFLLPFCNSLLAAEQQVHQQPLAKPHDEAGYHANQKHPPEEGGSTVAVLSFGKFLLFVAVIGSAVTISMIRIIAVIPVTSMTTIILKDRFVDVSLMLSLSLFLRTLLTSRCECDGNSHSTI
jgi:hypothetical protein